jgi:hypothetical protein
MLSKSCKNFLKIIDKIPLILFKVNTFVSLNIRKEWEKFCHNLLKDFSVILMSSILLNKYQELHN